MIARAGRAVWVLIYGLLNCLFNANSAATNERHANAALDDFAAWLRGVKHRHLRTLTRHPHHYAVAAGMTFFLGAVGAYERSAVFALWAYAVLENLTTLD